MVNTTENPAIAGADLEQTLQTKREELRAALRAKRYDLSAPELFPIVRQINACAAAMMALNQPRVTR